VSGALDTGAACNNRCAICPRASGPEIDVGALLDRARQGAGELTLHGGEPTLRGDLDAIVAAATENGRSVALETNGRAFAAAGRAQAIRAAGLERATVSLLGVNEAAHDFLSRAPGSFRQTIAGATRLVAARVALTIRIIVTRPAVPSLPSLATLGLGLGAREIRFSWARSDGETAREWLVPRYALALPELEPAAAAITRARREAAIDGVPSCLAPPGLRVLPTGAACFSPTGTDDRYSPRCEPCALRPTCPGVPAGYLARFGDAELQPR
jgi:cyclic pyranopterin phosphate synthase